ncbi:MAG: hypothetical protein KDK91_27750 [Gammaproteobacteria bacterium]|nr:hypothetical protein [Gammaproteobacteria bacterium]
MDTQPVNQNAASRGLSASAGSAVGQTSYEFNPAPLVSAIAGGLSAVPGIGGSVGSVVNGVLGTSGDNLLPTLIDKQVEVQRETLAFNLRSNIVKAHHDARMSAVRNMKA